jgi:hypothetical protein
MRRGAGRASEWAALLNGSQDRSPNGLRKLNRCEEALRVEVVIARLVDDSNLPMFRRFGIWQNPINLSAFQRNLVAFVL